MVQTLSLIGAAFAVGGSYFALDSLRDVLIAKTINTPVATRLAIASAAVIGGLFLFGRSEGSAAGQRAKETAKEEIIAKIEAAAEEDLLDPSDMTCHECFRDGSKRGGLTVGPTGIAVCEMCLDELEERDAEGKVRRHPLDRFTRQREPSMDSFRRKGRRSALRSILVAEGQDPNYMIRSDLHQIVESASRMDAINDEYPDSDYPPWFRSKLSVAAKDVDGLADNMGNIIANPEDFDAEDNTVYMIETEYHSWDNWQNDCIAYDSFGPYATEAGAQKALQEMMEGAAEDWTYHSSLQDPETGEPMFTFGLDRDEYGNVEIKPSGMSLSDFAQKHTKTEHKGGRDFDGMTYSGVVVAKQMKAADSDDDDDDTGLVPDKEPRRGAPDLWFAEIYEAECASCDTTHGFDFMCAICGLCLDCDPCTHDSKARGPFTDRDAESLNECGLKGRDCYACRGCGRCQDCTIIDGYSISSGDMYCVDCSKYRGSKESVVAGTKFTCDCGAVCTVDADTEIAYGPGGYDLRCGRNDDCRGDEKVLGAESFDDIYCRKAEKTKRWDDGRYRCGSAKNHAGDCSAWSRSGSGKQHFKGYAPCEHMKAGKNDCDCILGDGVDDSLGARLGNHPLFRKKNAEVFESPDGRCPKCQGGMTLVCDKCGYRHGEGYPGVGRICPNCGDPSCYERIADNVYEVWFTREEPEEKELWTGIQIINAVSPEILCEISGYTSSPRSFNRGRDYYHYDNLRLRVVDQQSFDAESSKKTWEQSEVTDADELVRLGKIFKVGTGRTETWQEYLDDYGPFVYVTRNARPWALWQPGSKEAVVRFNSRGKIRDKLRGITDIEQLYETDYDAYDVYAAEVFEAFSISDRPVSVKFGPGTSGNAKMKAVFTDASGDTKTTQFGYKGMSDFTKHKDEGRRSSYLARHGSKGQNQNWKDPTTAGALSRYVLWEKTSLPAAKSAFKKRFNLRAEGEGADTYIGYQTSPFVSESDRLAPWNYETIYSDEESL